MQNEHVNGLLSIIVPVYNSEKYLATLIESLIRQTYQNKEIILIDDGSTDRSPQICDSYAQTNDCVRVIHKENEGVSATRNRGLEEAKGIYITIPDHDDCVDDQAYEILIDALVKTGSDVAACDVRTEYKEAFQAVRKWENIPEPYLYKGACDALAGMDAKEHTLYSFQFNKVFTREIISNTRFLPVHGYEDALFAIDILARTKKTAHIDLPLYHYRYVQQSGSRGAKIYAYLKVLSAQENLIKWCDIHAPQAKGHIIDDYLIWNLKACEALLRHPAPETFAQIQKNISQYKTYISRRGFRWRILLRAALISWYVYKPLGMLNSYMKRLYVAVQNFPKQKISD